ncbi:hypothetical protein GEMRC1_009701 [Eukaryota sp. GEM-RC1]
MKQWKDLIKLQHIQEASPRSLKISTCTLSDELFSFKEQISYIVTFSLLETVRKFFLHPISSQRSSILLANSLMLFKFQLSTRTSSEFQQPRSPQKNEA